MFRDNKLFVFITVGVLALVLIAVLAGCKVESKGQYANAGDPCYFSGQEAVDEDTGHTLECKRDDRGDLTWLVK